MYKSRLQELCAQQTWPSPDYTVCREGPDHNPRFRASVTVNGINFDAPDLSKSSKDAQNKAAQAAVDHFAAVLQPEASPQKSENPTSYKAQLNTYAQKKGIDFPKYEAVREGLDHIPSFKASVNIENKTFSSQQFFRTIKEAENDAAKVAIGYLLLDGKIRVANSTIGSLSVNEKQHSSVTPKIGTGESSSALRSSPDENQQEEPNFCKNFLQELAQKEGIHLPKYTTKSHGADHMPTFSSTVEIGGEIFTGDPANTKKQAEMSAAKVAWVELEKRSNINSARTGVSLNHLVEEHTGPASQGSQSKAIKNVSVPKPSSVLQSHVRVDKHNEEGSGGSYVRPAPPLCRSTEEQLEPASEGSQSNAVNNSSLPKSLSVPPADIKIDKHKGTSAADNDQENRIALKSGSSTVPTAISLQHYHGARLLDTVTDCNGHIMPMAISQGKLDKEVATKKTYTLENPLLCEDEGAAKNGSSTVSVATIPQPQVGGDSALATTVNDAGRTNEMLTSQSNLGTVIAVEKDYTTGGTTSQKKISTSSPPGCSVLNVSSVSSVLCNRVKVFPRKPDVVLPEGTEFLPFSDDMWAAVSLDFSNREGLQQSTQRQEPAKRQVTDVPMVCDYCGKTGHLRRRCRRLNGQCLICGSADHQMQGCPKKRPDLGQPAPSQTSIPAIAAAPRPPVPAQQQRQVQPGRAYNLTAEQADAVSDGVADKSEEVGNRIENGSSIVDSSPTLHYDQRTNSSEKIVTNDNDLIDNSATSQLKKLGVEVIEDNLSEDGTSSSFRESSPNKSSTAEVNSASPMEVVSRSLLCNRVRVYPNKPGLVLPEGASLLPFSDDKWVAVSLDFSNQEGGISV